MSHRRAVHSAHQLLVVLPDPGVKFRKSLGRKRRFDAMLSVSNRRPQRPRVVFDDRKDFRVQTFKKVPQTLFFVGRKLQPKGHRLGG
jgi:hypothetical protein